MRISAFAAFLAGFLSFFSPCIFPIIPSYLLYLAGKTSKEFSEANYYEKLSVTINALFYVLGFSFVFIALGSLANVLGQVLFLFKDIIRIFGGIIIIIFGLYIAGLLNIKFLNIERKINLRSKPKGYAGSFIVGMAFGAAWIPCIGPALYAILILAGSSKTFLSGLILLILYSLGLAVPFIMTALFLEYLMPYYKNAAKHLWIFNILCGLLLVFAGILVLTDSIRLLAVF